jgi:putative ABC transport system ATP-binding protein
MIRLTGITRHYVMGEEQVHALDGVDLHIAKNEYVALIGPSGSGKSTLMNLIGCLDTPTAGTYILNGRDTSDMGETELAQVRNREIGFVFQSFHLLPRLTTLQNVLLPRRYHQDGAQAEDVARAHALLERVQLSNRLDHKPNELSGGQRQRVAIARALINRPRVVLADEPTGNLDSRTSDDIMDLLQELNRDGQTIVMVTHEADIAAFAQRTINMMDGKIVDAL